MCASGAETIVWKKIQAFASLPRRQSRWGESPKAFRDRHLWVSFAKHEQPRGAVYLCALLAMLPLLIAPRHPYLHQMARCPSRLTSTRMGVKCKGTWLWGQTIQPAVPCIAIHPYCKGRVQPLQRAEPRMEHSQGHLLLVQVFAEPVYAVAN